jgi:hypothetical protein
MSTITFTYAEKKLLMETKKIYEADNLANN